MKDLAARIVLSVKDTATAPLRGLKKQFSGLRGVVNSLGASFAAYFSGRAIVGFFRSIISEASDLETALSRVAAVTRATPDEMERLTAAAKEMGATTRYTAGEAAGAMESLGRAGLNATDTISALPAVLALAQGNSLELANAASIVTQAASGMGLAFDEAGRIADVFSLAAASANTNVEGLAHAFSYAAPTAQSAGVEIEELTAYIGALANAGFDGSRSGTALQRMMGQFQNPASAMRKAMADLGITTDDFTEAMEQLQGKGDAALPVITALGDRAGPALRALLQQGISGVRDLTETLRDSEGAAAEAAATMGDNMQGAMRGLSSAWSAVRQYLGEPLLGVIAKEAQDLAAALRKAATDGSLERLRDSIVGAFEAGVRAVRDFVTSFGSADEVVHKLTTATATTIEYFAKLGAAGRAAGNAIIATYQAVNAAISAVATVLTSTITFIARGVNGVIQGMNFLGIASDSVAMKSEALVETLDEMADALAKRTVDAAKASAAALGDTISAVGDLSSSARDTGTAADGLGKHLDGLADDAETAGASLKELESEVRTLEAELDGLVDAGAGIDEINAAMHRLGDAQDRLADATKSQTQSLTDQQREVNALRERMHELEQALDQMVESGADVSEIEQAMRELADATEEYEDAMASLGNTTEDSAAAAKQSITDVIAEIEAAGYSAVETGNRIETALRAAILETQDLDQLAALQQYLKDAGIEALVGERNFKALQREIDRTGQKIRAQNTDVEDLAKAYELLGLTSQEELDKTAQAADEAFQIIKASGAELDVVRAAFIKYAEAAIIANGGVADSTVKARAEALGLKSVMDETGKVIAFRMEKASESTDKLTGSLDGLNNETDRAAVSTGRLSREQRALRLEQLQGEMTRLSRAVAQGRITQDEYKEAVTRVIEELKELRKGQAETERSNESLGKSNEELAESFDKVADAAKRAKEEQDDDGGSSAPRRARGNDYSQWNNVHLLEQILRERQSLPRQSTAYHARMLKEEIEQIESRIKQLKEEKQIADLRRKAELDELQARKTGNEQDAQARAESNRAAATQLDLERQIAELKQWQIDEQIRINELVGDLNRML